MILSGPVGTLKNVELGSDLLEYSSNELLQLDKLDILVVLHDVVEKLAQLNLVETFLDDEVKAGLEELLESVPQLVVDSHHLLQLLTFLFGCA